MTVSDLRELLRTVLTTAQDLLRPGISSNNLEFPHTLGRLKSQMCFPSWRVSQKTLSPIGIPFILPIWKLPRLVAHLSTVRKHLGNNLASPTLDGLNKELKVKGVHPWPHSMNLVSETARDLTNLCDRGRVTSLANSIPRIAYDRLSDRPMRSTVRSRRDGLQTHPSWIRT